MAFPTIPTTGNGRLLSQNQNNTTAARTFPSLSSLTKNSGDLLIAIVVAYERVAASASFASWGGGFTELADIDGGATQMAVGIATKTSTGSETGTFTVTQGVTPVGHCALFLLSIAGAHGSTPPEFTALAVDTSNNSSAASLNPSGWDVEDTLWIAIGGNGETGTGGTWTGLGTPTPPTGYGSTNSPGIGTDAIGGIHAAVAFLQSAAASDNPDNFSNDLSNARNCMMLLAVRPLPSLVKTGGGTLERKGGAADAVTFVESGSGILVAVGAGARERLPATYEKVGLAVLGKRSYAGTGVLGFVGSGTSQKISGSADHPGSGIRGFVGAGADAVTFVEAGSGVRVLVGSASDATTWTETGAGVLVRAGSATDAVTFAKSGSAIRVLVGSASDAVTFTETGAGILSASGGGVSAKVGGAVAKAGTGIVSELKGAASDAVTWTETGAGVLVRSVSASDAVTFTETGAGIRGHVGAAADAATFVESGTGTLNAVGSGASALAGGTTYEKTGLGKMGATLGVPSVKTGAGVRGFIGSATDAVTFAETGVGILNRAASGASLKVGAYSKTGTGTRGLVGAASDAVIWQRTGLLTRLEFPAPPSLEGDYPPSLTAVGSGVSQKISGSVSYEKTGTGTRGFVGAAADAVTFTESGSAALVRSASATDAVSFIETGAGKLGASGGGVAVRVSEGAKTGAGVRGFVGSAADAATFVKTGAGVLARSGSAADAVTFTETGKGVLSASGGGTGRRGLEAEKTGTAISAHTARGADAVTFTKSVTGILNRAATGTDTAQFTKRGTGVLDRYASGEKFKLGEFVKFGSATAVFVASGAVETDLDRPPPGIITSTNTGRITRVRVGRITHSREGVLV